MRIRPIVLGATLAAGAVVACAFLLPDDDRTVPSSPNLPDAAVLAALNRPVSFEANGEPLEEVLRAIGKQNGAQIEIDRPALAAALSEHYLETPVTGKIDNVDLRSALYRLLQLTHDYLKFAIRGDAVVVTSVQSANRDSQYFIGRVYPLPAELSGQTGIDAAQLARVITGCFRPEAWEEGGGAGVVKALPGALAVGHRWEIQAEVAELIDSIVRAQGRRDNFDPIDVGPATSDGPDSSMRLYPVGDLLDAPAAIDRRKLLDLTTRTQESAVREPTSWSGRCTPRMTLACGDMLVVSDSVYTQEQVEWLLGQLRCHVYGHLLPTRSESPMAVMKRIRAGDTSPARAEDDTRPPGSLRTVVYDVRHLVDFDLRSGNGLGGSKRGVDYRPLRELIWNLLPPLGWGGPEQHATSIGMAGALVVTHTDDAHRRIESLLDALTTLQNGSGPTEPIEIDGWDRSELEWLARSLEARVSVDWTGAPMAEAVRQLSGRTRIDIRVDYLEEPVDSKKKAKRIQRRAGLDTRVLRNPRFPSDESKPSDFDASMPVTLRLDEVPVRAVLEALCAMLPQEVGCWVSDDSYWLPLYDACDSTAYPQAYPLHGVPGTTTQLAAAIEACVAPDCWARGSPDCRLGGSAASIHVYDGMAADVLVVTAPHRVHDQIERLFVHLRTASPLPPAGRSIFDSPERRRIERKLAGPADVSIAGLTLRQAVRRVAEHHEMNIVLDQRRLIEAGIELDEVIAEDPRVETLEQFLAWTVPTENYRLPRLAPAVCDNTVVITTMRSYGIFDFLDTRLYAVDQPVIGESLGVYSSGAMLWVSIAEPSRPVCRPVRWRYDVRDIVAQAEFVDFAVQMVRPKWSANDRAQRLAVIGTPPQRTVLLATRNRRKQGQLARFLDDLAGSSHDLPRVAELADGFNSDEVERIRRVIVGDWPVAVRARAALLIADGHEPPEELIDPLIESLDGIEALDPVYRGGLQWSVFRALAAYGPRAARAVPSVHGQWTRTSHPEQRIHCIHTLRELGPEAAGPLCQLLNDPDLWPPVREELCRVLADCGPRAAPAVERLLELVEQAGTDCRRTVRDLFAAISAIDPSGEAVRAALAPRMNDPDPETRERAFELHELVRLYIDDAF